jgi:hypothetical protein
MMAGEKRRSSYRPRLWILAAVAVVLALGLGLGLGLGLKHRHHNAVSNPPSTEALPFLNPQTSSNFVVGSIVGQSPQDRNYNFTVALANGAPDGVNKTMLVVNGTLLRSFRDRRMTADCLGAGVTLRRTPSGFFLFLVVIQRGSWMPSLSADASQ